MRLKKAGLKNIKVAEISLVDSPANKRIFYLQKNDGEVTMDKIVALAKAVGIEGFEDKVKAMTEDRLKEMSETFGSFSKYTDSMPDDLSASLKALMEDFISGKANKASAGAGEEAEGNEKGKGKEKQEVDGLAALVGVVTALVGKVEELSAEKKEKGEEGSEKTEAEKMIEDLGTLTERITNMEKRTGGKSTVEGNDEIIEANKRSGKWAGVRKQLNIS